MEFCIWQTSFFCVAHVMEILKLYEEMASESPFIYVSVCTHVCMHACVCVCVHMGACVCVFACVCAHLCICINTIIFKSLLCIFPFKSNCILISPCSLVALTNEHLSILREVCVINDSITHHPVRSHSTHPRTRPIREPPALQGTNGRMPLPLPNGTKAHTVTSVCLYK